MTFRSKIDLWLVAVLILASATPLFVARSANSDGNPWQPHVVIAVLMAAFSLWLLLSTKYTVKDSVVHVQSGPFSWKFAARGITSVMPSRSVISGPALSLHRLRIVYDGGKKSILISPLDPDGFIKAVEAAKSAA